MKYRMGEDLLTEWFTNGKNIRRTVWPAGDYVCVDGGDDTLWYYDAENDNLICDYKLGFHEIAAGDWEVMP